MSSDNEWLTAAINGIRGQSLSVHDRVALNALIAIAVELKRSNDRTEQDRPRNALPDDLVGGKE